MLFPMRNVCSLENLQKTRDILLSVCVWQWENRCVRACGHGHAWNNMDSRSIWYTNVPLCKYIKSISILSLINQILLGLYFRMHNYSVCLCRLFPCRSPHLCSKMYKTSGNSPKKTTFKWGCSIFQRFSFKTKKHMCVFSALPHSKAHGTWCCQSPPLWCSWCSRTGRRKWSCSWVAQWEF